jgi:hypothetical protein
MGDNFSDDDFSDDNFFDQDELFDDDDLDQLHTQQSLYDRWRPAIAAFAVLLTVVAIAVVANGEKSESVTSISSAKIFKEIGKILSYRNLPFVLTTGVIDHDDIFTSERRHLVQRHFDFLRHCPKINRTHISGFCTLEHV